MGRDGTLTEWLTPHMTTLRRGSLARNSFTFWATKCFFLVLVLLAMDAAMLAAEAMFEEAKVAAVGGVLIEAVVSPPPPPPPPVEAGSAANDSRLANCGDSHQANKQKFECPKSSSPSTVRPGQAGRRYANSSGVTEVV